MSAAVTCQATKDGVTAKDHAALIAEHFRLYNEEFGRITRRAALNFLAEDWHTAQLDAVARIELYEQRVARGVAAIASQLQTKRTDVALWIDIKRAYEIIVARRPDSDFYRTFFNSVTRDLFGTVGVNPEVEFCATNVGRASGAVPIRVYRVGGSLPTAVREILTDLPFGAAIEDTDAAVHRISAEIGRYLPDRPAQRPARIHRTDRAGVLSGHACLRGRPPDRRRFHHAAGSIVHQLLQGRAGRRPSCWRAPMSDRCSAMRARIFTWICRWSARRSPCCAPSCRASPSTSCIPCSAAPSRARPSAISLCKGIWTNPSTASCMPRASAGW